MFIVFPKRVWRPILLCVFLPLALAGFATAIIFGVQWSAVVILGRDQDSLKHHSVSKGADQ